MEHLVDEQTRQHLDSAAVNHQSKLESNNNNICSPAHRRLSSTCEVTGDGRWELQAAGDALPLLHQQDDSEEDDDEEQGAGDGAGDLHRVVRLLLLPRLRLPGGSSWNHEAPSLAAPTLTSYATPASQR